MNASPTNAPVALPRRTPVGDDVGDDSIRAAITLIRPTRGWFDWRLGLLWRYRDLTMLFVLPAFFSVYQPPIL